MQTFGTLKKIQGNQVLLEMDELPDVQKFAKWSDEKPLVVGVEFNDGRKRTLEQLKKAWALIHEVSDWSGYSVSEAEDEMKVQYMLKTGEDWFSQAHASVDIENEFITSILDFCFDNDVPFRTKTWDLINNDYHAVYEATIHRRCIICGKPHADIDHFSTVGIGRNRHKVDQTQFLFWALCREHHTIRHKMGIKSFAKKYQLKPVKLNEKDIKKLGI